MRSIVATALSGQAPVALSAESMMASAPSEKAVATSETSARVGAGSKILDAVIEQLGPIAKGETYARLEGRNMTMVLAPEKKIAPKKERAERAPSDAPTGPSDAVAPADTAAEAPAPTPDTAPDAPAAG